MGGDEESPPLQSLTRVNNSGNALEQELRDWDEVIEFLEDHGARKISSIPPNEDSLSLDRDPILF